MKNRLLKLTLFAVACCGLTPLPLRGQGPEVRTFPDFAPSEAYYRATTALTDGDRDDGLRQLAQLASANPDSTLGATCLFTSASYSEQSADRLQIYQRIIQEYPRSRFEIQARLGIAMMGSNSPAEFIAAADQLAATYGAPTTAQVIANPSQAGVQYRALPLEYQKALAQQYSFLGPALRNSQRLRDSILMCQFGMDYVAKVDPDDRSSFRNGSSGAVIELNGGHNDFRFPPPADPEVKVRTPQGNGPKGRRPKVRLEVRQRIAFSNLVDLNESTFQLDGVDVKPEVKVLKHTINPTPKKHQVYERLRLGFRPSQPLTAGQHTFTAVIVVDGYKSPGPGRVSVSVPLRCIREQDDAEDEDGLDDEEWGDD